MKAVTIGLVLFAFGVEIVCSQEKPDRFEKLKASYQRELKRKTDSITQRYLELLGEMQENYGKAGNLKDALAVREEKKWVENQQLSEPLEEAANEPGTERLKEMRETYLGQLKRAKGPVDKIYVDALVALQKKYTTEGNLQRALAVRAERDRFDPAKIAEKKKAEQEALELVEFLTAKEWDRDRDHLYVVLMKDGFATHRWGDSEKIHWSGGEAKWEVKDGEITLTHAPDGEVRSSWKLEKKGKDKLRISPITVDGKDWISGDFSIK